MSWFYIFFLLLAFWALPAPSDAYIARSTGCHHNGTWYADKSLVPTVEKCLNCQCNKKTLVCRLKVCPEMPMPPPRGCVVVEKRNTCCPYLSCSRLEAFYKIPITRRIIAYLDHYERESIDRVVSDNMLQRRSDDSEADLQACVKNGTVYKSGSAMSSSNLCSYCYCIGGTEKCVKPKCMLPVEGCKPIFVDSTCCPVRYDCSAKTSGKSSQEMRYRKTSNKHFLRMSQRLQRNRGCTVNEQFYAEGQKMKSDTDKPCDICFCIRGSRRCAPKKCSPALKNCMPVVPKGQCCPSSYDCGSQRDYRRSENSRQFNLFSLLFGKDDNKPAAAAGTNVFPAQYPHDRDPALTSGGTKFHQTHQGELETSSEKSIMDTIREGLEFIDGNTNHMLEENADLVSMAAKRESIEEAKSTTRAEADDADVNAPTELSFLDLILGETSDSPNTDNVTQPTTTPTQNELSWVDILLGPDEDQQNNTMQAIAADDSSSSSNFDRLDSNVEELGSNGEILVGAESAAIESSSTEKFNGFLNIKKLNSSELNSFEKNNKSYNSNQSNWNDKGQSNVDFLMKNISTPLKSQQPMIKPIRLHDLNEPTTPVPFTSTESNDLLSVILDGISGILDADVSQKNSSHNQSIVPSTKPVAQLPVFKPLPAQKTHTRINSKIASLVVSPPTIIINSNQTKNSPNIESVQKANTITKTTKVFTATSSPTTTTTTTTTPTPTTQKPINFVTTTTTKPLIMKTNPSILEADPLDDSTEPTLPPSLPNLKIIPFLPTDAVETDKTKSHEFFAGSPSLYEDSKLYPDISKHYETFAVDLDDENKAKYIYKFKVEGPDTDTIPAVIPKTPIDNLAVDAFLNYELTEKNGFSPPTKTEGGFVPKNPLALDDGLSIVGDFNTSKLNEIASATMHVKDITTTEPLQNNLTNIIDITTPDPFKDVIHTEPPPDLTRIVPAKENVENTMSMNLTYASSEINSTQSKHGFNSSINSNQLNIQNSTQTPSEAQKVQLQANKSSIETLLDIFMKEASDPSNESSTTSALPPFKRLPQTTIDHISINPAATTESIKKIQSTSIVTTMTTTTSNQTTKKFYRTKSPQGASSKNRTKSNTTRKSTAAPPFKDNKQKLNKITAQVHSSTTAAAAKIATTAKPTATTNATKSSAPIVVSSAIKTTKPSISSPKPTKSTTVKIATNIATSTERTHNPFLMSPFDKLPFMDASFEIKRRAHNTTPAAAAAAPTAANSVAAHTLERLDGLDAAYDVSNALSSSRSSSATTTTSVHPPYASVNEKHSTSFSNGLIDPTGILKLAGCNIYGRMYRVGRIILELSSPCVECKCTETGVACGQLDC